jgi:hypothetical protein
MAPRPIAVVLDGPPTPAWQARALAGLAESPVLDVVEVRLSGPRRRGLARRLHAAAERRLLHLGADALAPVPLDGSKIGPRARSESPSELRSEPGSEPRSEPATLVVWLAERPVPDGETRDVLYLRHGRLPQPAEDAFRRALLGGATCVETEVLLRGVGGTVVVVERTVSGVRPFSLTLSRDLALWKLAAVIRRAAERAPGLDLPAPESEPAGPAPSTAALIAHAATTWGRVLAIRLLFRRPWSVRVRERGPELTRGWSVESDLVHWARGHLYADPFLFEHEGRHHLFCEEQLPGAGRAVISHTELRLDGAAADPPTPVLARPYHLSYPFVFAHEGETFMIPETSAAARVELYRAVEFPHRWEREAVLIDDLDAADATLLAHEGRLWLFASVAPANASSLDELHVFWASSPRGPWRPHPRNPVVSDARCARPAGAVQRWGSRLVRPGQDGSRRYGGAISFREIDVLSSSDYAEHEIARLEPADLGDARATHTYAADGRFEAIDLRRREPRGRSRLPGMPRDRGVAR